MARLKRGLKLLTECKQHIDLMAAKAPKVKEIDNKDGVVIESATYGLRGHAATDWIAIQVSTGKWCLFYIFCVITLNRFYYFLTLY